MGRGRRSAVAWAAMLVLAACSPPGGSPSGAGQAASSTAPARSDGAPTIVPPFGPIGPPATPPPPGAQAGPEPVLFLPPGPASPADPPTGATYESISRLKCDDAAQLIPGTENEAIWTAVAAVCSAAVTGSSPQWAQASALVAALPRPPAQRCLEAAAVAGANRVLAFHAAHPAAPITFAQTSAEACPRRLTGATVLDPTGAPSGPSRTVVSGPVAGGTALRLDGFTGAVSGVLVNGVPDTDGVITVEGANSFDPVTLLMPPASAPGTVRLSLSGPLAIAGSIDFTYVAGPSASPSAGSGPRTTALPSPARSASTAGAATPEDAP